MKPWKIAAAAMLAMLLLALPARAIAFCAYWQLQQLQEFFAENPDWTTAWCGDCPPTWDEYCQQGPVWGGNGMVEYGPFEHPAWAIPRGQVPAWAIPRGQVPAWAIPRGQPPPSRPRR